jgi:site-specific recombinase XerD
MVAYKFNVKIVKEGDYNRVYVSHPSFKGRIKKHIGYGNKPDFENQVYNLTNELENYFKDEKVTFEATKVFIDQYVGIHIKGNISIFSFADEFSNYKLNKRNSRTHKTLVKATLNSYRLSVEYFYDFFVKKNIKSYPSAVTKDVLDNFFYNLSFNHNTKVKVHRRAKAFVKYLAKNKGLNIHPSYEQSIFNEVYDDQDPKDGDIALTSADVGKLIELRQNLASGDIVLQPKAYKNKGLSAIQLYQHNKKVENLTRSLDCFLYMVSTGMYYKDIMKAKIIVNKQGSRHLNYRRAKNNSLVKAIPIIDNGVFILGEMMNQYKIKSGGNFPLNISHTTFSTHLRTISILADIGFVITNKMARKTFASILYFEKKVPIHLVQILLGHKSVTDTRKYLRISDDILAEDILKAFMNSE